MGRKKIKNAQAIEKQDVSDKHVKKDSQDPILSGKKPIFEDHLLESVNQENITVADIKRITSKTFDFLRATGLRQTHISATTGINQSILSIILRDPCTKTISVNRKKDVIIRLCEYYNKINQGLVSSDPLTAPKICNSKKNGEVNQRKRSYSKRNASEDDDTNSVLLNSENSDSRPYQQGNFEEEKKAADDSHTYRIESNNVSSGLNELGIMNMCIPSGNKESELTRKNIFLLTSCTKCPVSNKEVRKTISFLDSSHSAPISSFVNGNALMEFTEFKYLFSLGDIPMKKKDYFTRMVLRPILIPLSVNLRHFITSTCNENHTSIEGSQSKYNPPAILSTLKGKNFRAEKFIWSSSSDTNSLWAFIEGLSRERHLSTFMNNDRKKRVFKWVAKEIENYKSLYLQFLCLIMNLDINPENNSLLICEIYLSESYGDVVINDKFKWNISNPTNLLQEYIEYLVSDLKLPHELFSELLYSATKQVFDEITDFVKRFDHIYMDTANVKNNLIKTSDQCEDDTSSNSSLGAGCQTRTSVTNLCQGVSRLPFYGNFVEWGNRAELEYDSDDNAKIYPIVENVEEKRQIENRNRFRKRR
ncbi:SNF5 like protein [Cryptosporidium canis]|uniref:SNF5 like protein n=1 Tax=Cryptosporidium canis TaxID=195482 RepID=A0A9D5DHR2_9CRYT|nr:SNF5 like protein [Cryptosporidium canis]